MNVGFLILFAVAYSVAMITFGTLLYSWCAREISDNLSSTITDSIDGACYRIDGIENKIRSVTNRYEQLTKEVLAELEVIRHTLAETPPIETTYTTPVVEKELAPVDNNTPSNKKAKRTYNWTRKPGPKPKSPEDIARAQRLKF